MVGVLIATGWATRSESYRRVLPSIVVIRRQTILHKLNVEVMVRAASGSLRILCHGCRFLWAWATMECDHIVVQERSRDRGQHTPHVRKEGGFETQ